jgi:Transposase C of IS166 homeodomain
MHEMPSVAADLRSLDRETLAALVLAQQEKLLSRDSEIEHLKLIIAKLRRMMFGTKSEKITREIEQLELKLEELEVSRQDSDHRDSLCQSTFRAKCMCICLTPPHALHVVVG